MKQRFFTVNDNGCSSAPRPQMSGISQGCTLSPLLFVLLMTVLLHDAVAMLPEDARREYKDGVISDCVYADDTLLIGTSDEYLNSFLLAVATAGRRYGCELHWQKFQVLAVGSSGKILSPAGEPLKHVKYLEYLGACLTADGDMSHELGRKIGEAKRTFTSLRRLWSHSALTWRRKLNIYAAVVESKLLYGLSSACFTKAQLRRLDGFQNRCVRQIIGVKTAYISRVSNRTVLEKADHAAASTKLLFKQLQLFGKVIRCSSDHPMRTCTFSPGLSFLQPLADKYVRRVGAPHKEFARDMLNHSVRIFGSWDRVAATAQSPAVWDKLLREAVF